MENDKNFIWLKIKVSDIPVKRKPLRFFIQNLKDHPTEENINDLAVTYIHLSRIDLAEELLLKKLTGKYKIEAFLNLCRMYYLLNEYQLIREALGKFIQGNSDYKTSVEKILALLETRNRLEEKVILMGELQTVPGFEVRMLEELGIWFFLKRNYPEAESRFEQILTASPFKKTPLFYMTKICVENERWADALLYSDMLIRLHPDSDQTSVYFMAARANYELNHYTKALNSIIQAPEKERVNLEYILLWRNILLSINKNADLSKLRPYLKKLKQNEPWLNEDQILFTESKNGKTLFNNIIYGK